MNAQAQDTVLKLLVLSDNTGFVRGRLGDITHRLFPLGNVTPSECADRLRDAVGEWFFPGGLGHFVVGVRFDDQDERHSVGVGNVDDSGAPVDPGSQDDRAAVGGVVLGEPTLDPDHLSDHGRPRLIGEARVEVEDAAVVVHLYGHPRIVAAVAAA